MIWSPCDIVLKPKGTIISTVFNNKYGLYICYLKYYVVVLNEFVVKQEYLYAKAHDKNLFDHFLYLCVLKSVIHE